MPPRNYPLAKLLAFDATFAKSANVVRTPALAGGTQLTVFAQPATGIIGVDEVGRGCLAGPVMAGAVMLPLMDTDSGLAGRLLKLNDSKQLTSLQRDSLSQTIRACSWYAIGAASPEEIDEINILRASHLAMRRAVQALLERLPEYCASAVVLVDGKHPIKGVQAEQVAIPKGDTKSASIAAASVVAKVERDKFMTSLAAEFPEYGWLSNKGYPSEDHRKAIDRFGRSQWHRRSFYSTSDKQLRLELPV